jgi:hypothetical protein
LNVRYYATEIYGYGYNENPPDLDVLLTGIASSHRKSVRKQLDSGPLTLDMIRQLQHKYKTGPCIGDLKNLQKFTVETHGDLGFGLDIIFTDIGGSLGFAMASPTLQHIGIRREDYRIVPPYLIRSTSLVSSECESLIRTALGAYAVIDL